MRIKPHQGQHIGEMSFLQHNKCECRPKKDRARQENPCGPCSERRKHLFVQDPQTCKCSCKNTDSRCKARQLELNERTCRCDKPRRRNRRATKQAGDVEENPGPMDSTENVIKPFMRFKVHMEGSVNGHEFEIEGEGEGKPYEGTQTAKLQVTKG
ncbi:hypothetical protein FV299_27400, partial [Escherichia coli]